MSKKTFSFDIAYDSYYNQIKKYSIPNTEILEIGGGANPSVVDRSHLSYTIIDPDVKELKKAPSDITKINLHLDDLNLEKQYDLVLTKMVLEHIENPDTFHKKILSLIEDNGRVIHFFACRYSIPAFVNRLLPESVGDLILKLLQNRNTSDHPKYPAFYKRTKGGVKSQIRYFEQLGYEVEDYRSYVGHKYFKAFPILREIEQLYTWLLVQLQIELMATVALVVLKKK